MMSTATLPSLSARDESLSRLRFPDEVIMSHGWFIEACLMPSMNASHTLYPGMYGMV